MIVGADRTWPHQELESIAAAHGVGERVEVRSYVDDAELAALYSRASVFAFLSEYEGFGLTPLEALAAGVPISCSIRRWRARSTAPRRPTCLPAADVGATRPRSSARRSTAAPERSATLRHARRGAAALLVGRGGDADAGGHRTHGATAVTMTPPKLSIVIVSFNTRADLERCLESLTANPPAIPHEIIVVDNASSDGSVDAVRAALAGRAGSWRTAATPGSPSPTTSASGRASGDAGAAAQQRLRRACRRDRSRWWRGCARIPTRPSPGRAWSTARAGRSCRSAG